MNMHCVMLRWGWQVSLAILTETWRPIVPGDAHCTLLGQTFCGFTSKQQHILQLCSGPASVRLSCVLTEKPLSYHPASKYLNGSPAKTTLPQTALQTIPQCDCGWRGYNGPSCDPMQSSLRNQALRWDGHLDADDYSMRQSTNNRMS